MEGLVGTVRAVLDVDVVAMLELEPEPGTFRVGAAVGAHADGAPLAGVVLAGGGAPGPAWRRAGDRRRLDERDARDRDDIRDAGEATAIAQRTPAVLGRPLTVGEVEHSVTASIGIAVSEGVERPAEDLIREADAAMYRAKERGQGRYELYDEAMRARATARLRMQNELARAVANDELRLVYQPIVALGSERVAGVEALVRWQHPERGLTLPGEFIPIAEETGAILTIGEWVLREACRQSARWRRE